MKKTILVYSGIASFFLSFIVFALYYFLPKDSLPYSRKNLYIVFHDDEKLQCENRLRDIYRLMQLYSLDKIVSVIPTNPSSMDLRSGSVDPKDYCRSWRSTLAALDNEQKGTALIYFETYTTHPCREWEITENYGVEAIFNVWHHAQPRLPVTVSVILITLCWFVKREHLRSCLTQR